MRLFSLLIVPKFYRVIFFLLVMYLIGLVSHWGFVSLKFRMGSGVSAMGDEDTVGLVCS